MYSDIGGIVEPGTWRCAVAIVGLAGASCAAHRLTRFAWQSFEHTGTHARVSHVHACTRMHTEGKRDETLLGCMQQMQFLHWRNIAALLLDPLAEACGTRGALQVWAGIEDFTPECFTTARLWKLQPS